MDRSKLKLEQIKAIDHQEGDLLVSASAGSGKTFVMINRLIGLIVSKKADIEEVLAVTFTESAAKDMKAKLKEALLNEIQKSDDNALIEQLSRVNNSDISTIHSFCLKTLRKYFFKVGISPDFEICEPIRAKALMTTAINKTFREYYLNNDKQFLLLCARHSHGRSDSKFRELILDLYKFCISEADLSVAFNQTFSYFNRQGFDTLLRDYKNYWNDRCKGEIVRAKSYMRVFSENGYEKTTNFCQAYIDTLEEFLQSPSIYDVKLFKNKPTFQSDSKMDEIVKMYKEAFKKDRENFYKACISCAEKLTDEESDFKAFESTFSHTQKLHEIMLKFSENYKLVKEQENLLDFNDLEHYALMLLQDEETLKSVKDKYKYLFIDEYQDVNGVQESIVNLIKKDNLFMVGDVKQSIYGFRGCRSDFFAEKFNQMSITDQTLKLNYNFRSAQKTLDLVNKIFSYCMTTEFYGQEYSKESRLIGGGIYPEDKEGRFEIHHLITQKKENIIEKPRVYDVLEEITKDQSSHVSSLAMLVHSIINKELGKTYYDIKEKTEKQITYKDIAVLIRSVKNNTVSEMVKELIKRQVPVSSEIEEEVADYPEIQILISLLKILDCFSDDIPLATVLRSPVGGFSLEDLYQITFNYQHYLEDSKDNVKKDWGFYQAYCYALSNADEPLKSKLITFDKYVKNLRFLSDFKSAYEILNKVITEKHLESYLFAHKDGEIKVNRVRAFIKAGTSNGKNLSVKEFLHLIEDDKSNVTMPVTSGDNTVKVMTIHASKGLEFPVVIVCGLEKNINNKDSRKEVFTDRKYGISVKKYDDGLRLTGQTVLNGVLKERVRVEQIKEEMRLFYVALTRAMYSTHLTYISDKSAKPEMFSDAKCFWDLIPEGLPITEYNENDFKILNQKISAKQVMFSRKNPEIEAQMQRDFSFSYPFEVDTSLPLKSSVTATLTALQDEYEFTYFDKTEQANPSDAEKGIIAHKVMEHFDFASEDDIYSQTSKMVADGVVLPEELKRINLNNLQKAINNACLKELKGKMLYREKSFIVSLPTSVVLEKNTDSDVVVQGIIDLLAITENGAEIIDYKYSGKSKDALKEKYARQLNLYALAVEKILKIKVVKKTIVSLMTGETVEID